METKKENDIKIVKNLSVVHNTESNAFTNSIFYHILGKWYIMAPIGDHFLGIE